MDTEILLAITGSLSVIVGGALTALVILKTEARRQKAELERTKLAWKREERQRNLEPVRGLLDQLTEDIWEYYANLGKLKTELEISKEQEAHDLKTQSMIGKKALEQRGLELKQKIESLQTDFLRSLTDYNIKAAKITVKVGDVNLNDLVVHSILGPLAEGIVKGSFDILELVQLEDPISRAYRRIEELATEF